MTATIVTTRTLEVSEGTATDYARLAEIPPPPDGWTRIENKREVSPGGSMVLFQTVDERKIDTDTH